MPEFIVSIFDYEKKLFEGSVAAVSAHNTEGKFDILANHANFISIIDTDITVQLENGETKSWPIENGVIRCLNQTVNAYLVTNSDQTSFN